jgi:hypothetical protein
MEGRETPIMQKNGESKMIRIMMATVRNVISEVGRTKFQATGFLLNGEYYITMGVCRNIQIDFSQWMMLSITFFLTSMKDIQVCEEYIDWAKRAIQKVSI